MATFLYRLGSRAYRTAWPFLAFWLVLLIAVGPLVSLLHLSGPSTVLWLIAVLVPHTLVGGYDGLLQGTRRYGRLALVNTTFGVLKSGGGITGLIVGGTPEAALVGMALGCAASAVVGWTFSGRPGFSRGIRAHVLSAAKASGSMSYQDRHRAPASA